MKANIFIPKEIKVGFQERDSTYTKKLAYVIYYDLQNKLRKETSWQSWRDEKIEPKDFENVPTSGFVLNKKVGDYVSDWNHRQAYVRVYDPRDFEFEITIENLLYILENANSIKGKGLEGEFIYGWDGKELLLIPTESPDYKEINKYNNILVNKEFIKPKELKIGATYLNKNNNEMIYMGTFDYYDDGYQDIATKKVFETHSEWRKYRDENNVDKRSSNYGYAYGIKYKKQRMVFAYKSNRDEKYYFNFYPSISKKFIATVDENCVSNYSEIFEQLEVNSHISPIDNSKDKYVPHTLESFIDLVSAKYSWYSSHIYTFNFEEYTVKLDNDGGKLYIAKPYNANLKNMTRCETIKEVGYYSKNYTYEKPIPTTLEELFEILKPQRKEIYLQNGKLYTTEY
jgi:hypothetical protein